jgi:uncharacterized membrane protein YraQ (UPF0718 family)
VILDTLSNFTAVFLGIFLEAAPYLLLGTLASAVVEVFVRSEDLAAWLPKPVLLQVAAGGLLGLFFPVCECGVVPLTRRLIWKGMPPGAAVAFLLAAPVLNPVVIASTFAAFGNGPVLWGRLGLTFLVATATGLVFSLVPDGKSLLRAPEDGPGLEIPVADGSSPQFRLRFGRVLVIAADEFFEMGRYLVLGSLLAALLQTFFPQQAMLEIGRGPVLSVLALVLLAVILSVCSTVDAFIALAFVGTFTTGSILAFLVYGPMVDIKSTLMFLRVFKRKNVAYLALLPLGMTVIAAILWNMV